MSVLCAFVLHFCICTCSAQFHVERRSRNIWPPSIRFDRGSTSWLSCLIVAVSLVAVETDVGETISASKVAFVCGLWSVKRCCVHQDQSPYPAWPSLSLSPCSPSSSVVFLLQVIFPAMICFFLLWFDGFWLVFISRFFALFVWEGEGCFASCFLFFIFCVLVCFWFTLILVVVNRFSLLKGNGKIENKQTKNPHKDQKQTSERKKWKKKEKREGGEEKQLSIVAIRLRLLKGTGEIKNKQKTQMGSREIRDKQNTKNKNKQKRKKKKKKKRKRKAIIHLPWANEDWSCSSHCSSCIATFSSLSRSFAKTLCCHHVVPLFPDHEHSGTLQAHRTHTHTHTHTHTQSLSLTYTHTHTHTHTLTDTRPDRT